MANKTFPTDYSAASALTGTELVLLDQSGTKKATVQELADFSENGSSTEPVLYLTSRFTIGPLDADSSFRGLAILASASPFSMAYASKVPCYTPAVSGHFRDPSIVYWKGKYFVAYTAGEYGAVPYFSIISSENLVDWEDVGNVTVDMGNKTWGPEFFEDGDTLRVIVGANDAWGADGVLYELHALNDELTSWSAPVPLTGFGVPVNDATMRKIGDTYYLALYVGGGTLRNQIWTSSTLHGPYSVHYAGHDPTWSYFEGASLVQLADERWMLTADDIASRGFTLYSLSSDNMASWSTYVQMTDAPQGLRHGTTIKLTGWKHFRTIMAASLCAPTRLFGLPTDSGFSTFDGGYKGTVTPVGAGTSSVIALAATPQTLTTSASPTAVSLTTLLTKLTTTGAHSITLAAGFESQRKTIVCDFAGGAAVLTASAAYGWSTITFSAVGDIATLVFVNFRGWIIESIRGAVAA